jgi:hypothetical protein
VGSLEHYITKNIMIFTDHLILLSYCSLGGYDWLGRWLGWCNKVYIQAFGAGNLLEPLGIPGKRLEVA